MRFLLLIILTFFPVLLFSQSVIFSFKSNDNENLSYVSVIDTQSGKYEMADRNGFLEFEPGDSGYLKISRVGYRDTFIAAHALLQEDTQYLLLEKDIEELEGVTVSAHRNKLKKRRKSDGYFVRKGRDENVFSTHMKLGIIIDDYTANQNLKILKKIQFRLVRPGNLRKGDDYRIEIKLYAYKNGRLSEKPINTQPIFFNFEDAGKKNSIDLEESIVLPEGGIFISFEFPNHPENKKIRFGMVPSADPSKSFGSPNRYPNWEDFDIRKHIFYGADMHLLSYGRGEKIYSNFKIGIQYDEYE